MPEFSAFFFSFFLPLKAPEDPDVFVETVYMASEPDERRGFEDSWNETVHSGFAFKVKR